MGAYMDRRRMFFETILIAVGLVACAIYWWHSGELRMSAYVLFLMSAAAGYIGFLLRFWRRTDLMSSWSGWSMVAEAAVPLLGSMVLLAAASRLGFIAYFILAAYGLMVVATEMERRAVAARRAARQRQVS